MSVDWTRWQDEITRLYVTEDKSAEETIQTLRDQHDVKITIKQFKSRYSGLKKVRASEWRAVKGVIQKRKADGKGSAVFLNNRPINPNRLAREMRRYCGARGQDATGNEAVIDLGVGTMNKHRLEIRTPAAQLTHCPNGSPHSADITAGNANISVEDVTNEYVPDLTGWMPHFELENADLSTPKLRIAEALFPAEPVNDFDLMVNDTATYLSPSGLFEDNSYTPIMRHHGQLILPNSTCYTGMNHSAFSLPTACLSQIPGRNIWSSNLSQPTFLLLPDVCSIIDSLHTSNFFIGDNMVRLQQLVGKYSEKPHHRNGVSLDMFGVRSASNLQRLVSKLANGFLSRIDSTDRSDDTTALESFIKTDRRMLHLIFSTAIHRCSNNTMQQEEFAYFCNWIVRAEVKGQLLAYLQKCPAISNAFAEAILRLLSFEYSVRIAFVKPMIVQIIELYRDESLHISKKVCGLLLHAVIHYSRSIDLAVLLIARGAELSTVAAFDHEEKQEGTPLMHAIIEKNNYMVEYFLEIGSTKDRELDRDDLCNGLIVALKTRNFKSAELILSKGADMHHQFCVESKDLDDCLFREERTWGVSGYPMLHRLLDRHRILLDHKILLDDVVDAAASGNQALSKVMLEHNITQEMTLEAVLCQAVMWGKSLAVRTLLRRGVDPDARNRQTGSHIFRDIDPQVLLSAPLQVAIEYAGADILVLLLNAGASVDEVILSRMSHQFKNWEEDASSIYSILRRYRSDILGASALELAAFRNDLAGCDLLLDLGAPIDLHGAQGKNALQAASEKGYLLLVQFLLDQGADANAPAHDDGGRTALQAAIEAGHDNVANCLLDAKADIRAPPANKNGKTVLEAFVNPIRSRIVWPRISHDDGTAPTIRYWLSQGAPINRSDSDHGNVLHGLIRQNHNDANECLGIALQAGARVDDRDQFSRGQMTPLQAAAEVGNLDAVRLLLEYGANVNASPSDEFGRTALQAAACREHPQDTPAMVEFLLSLGADVNAPPAKKGGITALQGAAIAGDTNVAQILLDHGADVNAAPAAEEGRTAIEGAAEQGRLDMVRFLISVGAVDLEKGFSRAIELPEEEYHFTVADFLREQQDLSAGFGVGMEDMFGGDFSSQDPMPGFVFTEENLENFAFQ